MKIGKHKDPTSSISTANSEMIVVRGLDLCKDLIGSVSITEHFWLLVTGKRPTAAQTRVLDSCLVAIAEHGLVPSVQAARSTYAAGPEAMQGAVAAGILGCGSVILGSAENAGKFLAKINERGGSVIYGRSDSTINRQGIRMGTSELYSAVEGVPEVMDSLVVDVPTPDGADSTMWLFTVMAEGVELDDELEATIRRRMREDCSPRHVPELPGR